MRVPRMGRRTEGCGCAGCESDARLACKEEVLMRTVKRLAVALGSLLALAVAGGAHWRF